MKIAHLFLAAAAIGVLVSSCAKPSPVLLGTKMTKVIPAVDFSLTDQKGAAYRLSAAKGKVVVLSFIYTHCDDICPFVALKIKDARDLLGPLAEKVEFVAVTTDPERDTPEVNAAYSRDAGLYDSWHFVTGSVVDVKKVWTDFGIGVHKVADSVPAKGEGSDKGMADMNDDASKGLSQPDITHGKSIGDKFGGGYEVTHTAPFWFIDPRGNLRAVMNADAAPGDLVANVKALLGGG